MCSINVLKMACRENTVQLPWVLTGGEVTSGGVDMSPKSSSWVTACKEKKKKSIYLLRRRNYELSSYNLQSYLIRAYKINLPKVLQASTVKSHVEEAQRLKLWDFNIANGPKEPTTHCKTIL